MVVWAVGARTGLLEQVVALRRGCHKPQDLVPTQEFLVGVGVQQRKLGDMSGHRIDKRPFGVLCAQGGADQFSVGSLGSL